MLLNSLKSQLSSNDRTPHDAKIIYQAIITSASQTADATSVTAAPRNVKQIRNTQKTQRNASRLSRYALYEQHEFAYDSNFIYRIVTYPDLSLICYNPSIVEVFSSLLSSAANSDKPTVTMTYDTTFNLGDFYVSGRIPLGYPAASRRPTINRRPMERVRAARGSPAGGRKAPRSKARVNTE